MKPEAWQIQEAIDNACRRPEYRFMFKMELADFLKGVSLILLDDLIRELEKPEA